jgi:hypothetical protein
LNRWTPGLVSLSWVRSAKIALHSLRGSFRGKQRRARHDAGHPVQINFGFVRRFLHDDLEPAHPVQINFGFVRRFSHDDLEPAQTIQINFGFVRRFSSPRVEGKSAHAARGYGADRTWPASRPRLNCMITDRGCVVAALRRSRKKPIKARGAKSWLASSARGAAFLFGVSGPMTVRKSLNLTRPLTIGRNGRYRSANRTDPNCPHDGGTRQGERSEARTQSASSGSQSSGPSSWSPIARGLHRGGTSGPLGFVCVRRAFGFECGNSWQPFCCWARCWNLASSRAGHITPTRRRVGTQTARRHTRRFGIRTRGSTDPSFSVPARLAFFPRRFSGSFARWSSNMRR